LLVALAVVLSLTGSGLSAAGSAQNSAGELIVDFQNEQSQDEEFDTRSGSVAPTSAQRSVVAELGAEVRWNRLGTPSSLIKYGGFLARGIQAKSAESAARAWVDANASLLRLSSSETLELVSSSRLLGTKSYAVNFHQRVDGVLVSPDGSLSIGVKGSARRGWKVAYVSSTVVSDASGLEGSSNLTATGAFVSAVRDVDVRVDAGDIARDGRQNGWTVLELDDSTEPQLVRTVAFPTINRGVVRAFETNYFDGVDEGFQHIIDAQTGEVLFRANIVHQAVDEDNPEWKVFPANPPASPLNQFPWNYQSNDTREVWCWVPQQGCDRVIANPASPAGWDTDAESGTPTNTTAGNNNNAAEAWVIEDGMPVPPSGYRPESPTREYIYDWTNEWFEEGCNPDTFVVGSGNDIDAAAVNLFAMHNRMHDWSYNLGFTEVNWNAQNFNFGKGGLGGDALEGRVQSGAVEPGSRDNANMGTRPDGTPSVTNMFMWQPIAGGFYAPCVDGDYDQAVIAHEFAHMVENRMIGKGNRRTGFHAGAMGESVADLMAMEYLNEYGFVTGGVQRYAVGAYVTGNPAEAIRNYNMSWQSAGRFPQVARDHDTNPLNFGSFGYDIVGPQVHATGEIWSATNFDIRTLLSQRYGTGTANVQRRCADGELPATSCPGNRRWIQLMYDSFLLQPTAPSMLDARDAILASDMMRFGGANQDLLWLAFARRGFGSGASVDNADDVTPVPSWESPEHGEATLTFEAAAKDEGGAPITDFDVYVGDYEARSVPIDTTEPFVQSAQRGYNFVAVAPGYGHVRFAVRNLSPGQNRTISIHFPTNWASQSQGATASGDGESHASLIDDSEGTNWGTVLLLNEVVVDPPSSAAGAYNASGADFGPPPTEEGFDGDIVLVNDGSANPTQGCGPLVGFPAGAIALVDRGTCSFVQKVNNAQDADAGAVIVANNAPGPPSQMTGDDPDIVIPSVMVSQADGTTIKSGLPATGTVRRRQQVPAQGQQTVIDLGAERSFNAAKVSAMLVPGQNRFIALRQFELQVCTAGGAANPTCDGSVSDGWTSVLVSHPDAFPAVNPRPVAPELQLRAFDLLDTVTATHVKLIVVNNQCTGQPAFQGEQDQDPNNATDCRDTIVANQVRAAELQLFSSSATVDGAYMAE
jgi:extracellular elastinolytic metalloproteinase